MAVVTNLQIAKLLRSVAAALSLDSARDNHFRVVAYERAADAIEHASSEAKDLWDDEKLRDLAGVGKSIASYLGELFRTGKVKHFEQVLKGFPPAMFELMEIPGIGPKGAYKLCKELGISKIHGAVAALEKAAKKNRIAALDGFGSESQAKILLGIAEYKGRSRRLLLHQATVVANSIIAWMRKDPAVKQINSLGSLRRQVATVGDVDIAIASDQPKQVIELFTRYPHKSRVLEAGEHTASLVLPNDCQVDLMVQPEKTYGALLQHFTGSKHHNVALREYALKKGYSLSEYGIKTSGTVKQFTSEEQFYNFLGLDWIPPELREDNGEIELAKQHKLPRLVELTDITGDLQMHSSFDINTSHDLGQSSAQELVLSAQKLGYQYIGITDHNPKKPDLDLMKKRNEYFEQIKSTSRLYVFNSLEIDIRSSGIRAISDSHLDLLDYACVSIHSSFRLDRDKMTTRVLQGMDHPKVRFLAHPTGRLLNEREGIELDWDKVFDFCVRNNKALEIDSWPNRLDLPDTLVKQAANYGVKFVVDTDSHAADQLVYMRYGVAVARRGWLTKDVIINTRNIKEVKSWLCR